MHWFCSKFRIFFFFSVRLFWRGKGDERRLGGLGGLGGTPPIPAAAAGSELRVCGWMAAAGAAA